MKARRAFYFILIVLLFNLTASNRLLMDSPKLSFLLRKSNTTGFSVSLGIGLGDNKYDLLVDLSSKVVSLPSLECNKCCRSTIKKFNTSVSKTFKTLGTHETLKYSKTGEFVGSASTDNFYSKSEVILKEFHFNLFKEEKHLNNIDTDGILGLGFTEDEDDKLSFVYAANRQKLISQPRFYLFLSETKQSHLFIGSQTNDIIQSSTTSSCHVHKPESGENLWGCQITGVQIHNKTENLKNTTVVFEASVKDIYIPEKQFDILKLDYLGENVCDTDLYGRLRCKCENKDAFPDITLNFPKNVTFQIKSKNVVSFNSSLEYPCQFNIIVDDLAEYWVIGYSGYLDTLIYFDYDSKKIGFSSKEAKGKDIVIEETGENNTIIYLLWIAILAVVIYFTFKHLTDKKNQTEEDANEKFTPLENK